MRSSTTALALKPCVCSAAMLDVRAIVRTTYELEGDRLEVLLVYDRIERLRAVGHALQFNHGRGVLPNVDSVLRSTIKLGKGVEIDQMFKGMGVF